VNAQLKAGEPAVLKGNQEPVMVIESILGDDAVCVWHTGTKNNKKVQRDTFKMHTLEPPPGPWQINS